MVASSFYLRLVNISKNNLHFKQIQARLLVSGLHLSTLLVTELCKSTSSLGDFSFDHNLSSCNKLMRDQFRNGNLDAAEDVFKAMKNPNTESYNVMLQGLLQHKRPEDAINLFYKMQYPDEVSRRTLLFGLSKNGRYSDALKLFHNMQNSDTFFHQKVNNSMLEAFFKVKRVKEACNLFLSLPSKGLDTDLRMYNMMMYGLCKTNHLSMAETIVSRIIIQSGFSPDGCTYNPWIRAYVRNRDVITASSLIKQMKKQGFPAEEHTILMIENMVVQKKLPESLLLELLE